jgi:hypothetical protein
MARGYSVGNVPPQVSWTIVRGDTAAFKVYVTNDAKAALTMSEWTISMKIKRPNSNENLGIITDDATLVLTLTPAPDENDLAGEFTVSLTENQSVLLQTGDIFDIQLSQVGTVWTVAQGKLVVIEDVTD